MSAAAVAIGTLKKIPNARWWRVLPPAIIVYIIAYMDRMNFGFAMAGGINKDLGMTATMSGFAAGIFFWGFLLLQGPAGHMAEHHRGKTLVAWTIVAWGGISLLTGFAQNVTQLLILRFLLGVAEGAVHPAILAIIAKWFPEKELGRANSIFLISLPLSAALTNPISGWMVSNYNWRALFIFEGIISLALMFVWIPLLNETPEEAKWISKEEKEYLRTTLAKEKAAREEKAKSAGVSGGGSYKQLVLDKNFWILNLMLVCASSGAVGYVIWLPTLLKALTKMSLTYVGFLSVLPLTAAIVGLYGFGAMSDKKGNRRFWCSFALFSFGVLLSLAVLFPKHIWLAYGLLVLAGLVSKAIQGVLWTIPALVFPPRVVGGSRGLINGIGNLGGFMGPLMFGWFVTKTGRTDFGIYGLSAILIFGSCVTLLLPKITAGFKYHDEAKPKAA